jgi:hypothetical protein
MQFIFLLLLTLTGLPKEEKVMICKSATAYAYHLKQCQGLRECRHDILTITLKEAIDGGRKSCGYCHKNKQTTSLPVKSPAGGQCGAITKKRSQCSRKALL